MQAEAGILVIVARILAEPTLRQSQCEQRNTAGRDPSRSAHTHSSHCTHCQRIFGAAVQVFMAEWKFALRSLSRRPGFLLTSVLLLTLGVGAGSAFFSVVHTVLLKPLPYPDPDRLVRIIEANSAKSQKESLAAPCRVEDWNRLSRTFTAIAASYAENVTDTSGQEPERLSGLRVLARYFDVYGSAPALGRMFTPDEERAGGPLAVVISHGLWMRRFGGDPQAISHRLIIGGRGYSIVGVAPRNFLAGVDLWIPAQFGDYMMRMREARFMVGVGRMKPGVTLEQARADLETVQRRLGEQFPETDKDWSTALAPLKQVRVGDSAKQLLLLFGAVALLLLITTTNIAGLSLADLRRRERELAVRSAIGASRTQVVLSVMREMALIAITGGIGGWVVAAESVGLLKKLFAHTPRMGELQLDWRAVAFAAVASLLSAAVFGLFPALRATNSTRSVGLFRAARGIAGRRGSAQSVLVAGQIAVTLLLLATAGLLVRTFDNLTRVELGFQPGHSLDFHVAARWDEDRTRIAHMQERLIAELTRLPGVEAAGITNFLPVSGATLRYQVSLEGNAASEDVARMPAGSRTVSTGYLKAIRAKLLMGQWCPDLRTDFNFNAPTKVMVNRRFVDVYSRGENLVGRHLELMQFRRGGASEIVGVVSDIREDAPDQAPYPYVYHCAAGGAWPDPEYVVRTAGEPRALIPAVRQIVRQADPSRAIFGMRTLDEALGDALEEPRFNAEVLSAFALSALLLAAVGLYGLMAQMVSARRQELGIRIALGAHPARAVTYMMERAGRLIALGAAAGLVLTAISGRALHSLVFGVNPLDRLSIASALIVLLGVCGVAAFLPARTAARIDPVESMRSE
jgi:predicted permease